MVGLVGASIDYSRANSIKADLQSSLDATALMLSKTAATMTSAQLTTAGEAYFKALFNRPEAGTVTLNISYTTDGGSAVTVSGATSVKPQFISIVPGLQNIVINTSSTVNWGSAKLRVALVLDNTGSMSETDSTGTTKLSALKTASHNLLTTLKNAAASNGDVQVAIIPFANGVNVGTANVNATWLDWSDYNSSGGGGDSWGNTGGSSNSSYSSGSWSSSGGSSWSSGSDKSKWQGCVMDRDQDYDVKNTTPTTNTNSTLFPTIYNSACPISLMSLSSDWTALNSKIDAMIATGSTNQTIGLAWGWQALTGGVPLSAPTLPADTRQVIILLTDGLNTENRWTTDQSKIDAREQIVCANIKNAGITVYTVLVMAGNSAVLQGCASPDTALPMGPKYFALTSTKQIVDTFKTIGTNLSALRIAK
jgi:uncharacterized membrane protein YgcG